MSTDIFRTGFEMDTSDLKKGTVALEDVAKSADKADKSIEDLDKSTKKTEKTFTETTITVEEFAEALDIDAKDFDATQKKIFKELDKTGKGFRKTKLEVERFVEDQIRAERTVNKTGQVLDKQGNEVIKLTRRWKDLQTKLKGGQASFEAAQKSAMNLKNGLGQAKKGMKLAGNSSQMLGYQLQDIAVQAQMGASWFTIIGQQGSQLASVLGPKGALIGAVIAIGSALGGVLFKAMGNVTVNAKEMREEIDATSDSIKAMDLVTKNFLAKEETNSIVDRTKEIENLNNAIRKTEESLKLTEKSKAFTLARKDLKDAPQTLQILLSEYSSKTKQFTEKLIDLKQKIKTLNDEVLNSGDILSDIAKSNDISKYYQAVLDSIKITSKAEQEKWNSIQKGVRERQKELEVLKQIEMTTSSVLSIENNTRETAIAKGKAQEMVLKNTKNAAIESQINSLKDFGKTESQIEQERYTDSLEMLRDYAEEKSWLQAKLKENELLLEADHQAKLIAIEKSAMKEKAKEGNTFIDNAKSLSNAANDIVTITTAKKKAQLQADISNTAKFSAAEIAIKERTLRAIFEKEKNANLGRIAINTAVALSESLTNPAKFIAVGLAGAAQLVAANSATYSGGATIATGGGLPASVNNTNNNSGGNITNVTINGQNTTGLTEDGLINLFKDGFQAFDADSEQAGALR